MSTTAIMRCLYYLPAFFAAVDAIVLFRRKLHREVPWFATYLIFAAVSLTVLGVLFELHNPAVNFFGGWIADLVLVTLATLFILEGWQNLLHEYPAVKRLGTIVVIVVALVLLIIAAVTAPYGASTYDIMSYVVVKVTIIGMRSARFVLVGLIVSFFAFTTYLALSWKHFQFGILLGYGLYCAASLACKAYQTKMMGAGIFIQIGVIDSTAYILTLILWLTYLLRSESSRPTPLIPPTAKADLEHWNEALSDLMNKKPEKANVD